MVKMFAILGSLSALVGVAIGAFAAHALKDKLPPDLFNVFEVGVRYQMYHALGLFVVAWAAAQFPGGAVSTTGWLFVAGTLLFSGSLYALSLTGMRWLGMVTPLGGLCFLAGWAWLGWCIWKSA
jgi:uncharacterized membrane protein YgdD (TMEM256/DUF423 family)